MSLPVSMVTVVESLYSQTMKQQSNELNKLILDITYFAFLLYKNNISYNYV